MPADAVRLVALYEDRAQEAFVRGLTRRLGLRPERLIRCGDCERVVAALAQELQVTRARMTYQRNLGLLVVLDADAENGPAKRGGFSARLRWLEETVICSDTGGPRGADERISFLVPALEIESWYIHLCVPALRPISEHTDYKESAPWRSLAEDLGKAAKEAMLVWEPPLVGEPASISAARGELTRL